MSNHDSSSDDDDSSAISSLTLMSDEGDAWRVEFQQFQDWIALNYHSADNCKQKQASYKGMASCVLRKICATYPTEFLTPQFKLFLDRVYHSRIDWRVVVLFYREAITFFTTDDEHLAVVGENNSAHVAEPPIPQNRAFLSQAAVCMLRTLLFQDLPVEALEETLAEAGAGDSYFWDHVFLHENVRFLTMKILKPVLKHSNANLISSSKVQVLFQFVKSTMERLNLALPRILLSPMRFETTTLKALVEVYSIASIRRSSLWSIVDPRLEIWFGPDVSHDGGDAFERACIMATAWHQETGHEKARPFRLLHALIQLFVATAPLFPLDEGTKMKRNRCFNILERLSPEQFLETDGDSLHGKSGTNNWTPLQSLLMNGSFYLECTFQLAQWLIEVAPDATGIMHERTKTFPFQIAAMKTDTDEQDDDSRLLHLNLIYTSLREAPNVLKTTCRHDADTHPALASSKCRRLVQMELNFERNQQRRQQEMDACYHEYRRKILRIEAQGEAELATVDKQRRRCQRSLHRNYKKKDLI